MPTDTGQTDTTPVALPFIGGGVLAVPCRVPQNIYCDTPCRREVSFVDPMGMAPIGTIGSYCRPVLRQSISKVFSALIIDVNIYIYY